MQRILAYALVGVSSLFIAATVIAATTVTNAYDQPSSLTKSVGANHTFTFVTDGNVLEGQDIGLTFDDGFTLASLTEDDVDISDDGVDLTTAADCSGSEQASVEFTSLPADSITITLCVGDGGTILAGSTVVIEVGMNAASSGLGANRITNPSTVGTYYVNLSGTFGGSASFPLPIHNDDTSGISATITAPAPESSSSGSGSSGSSSTGGTTGGTDTGTDTGGVDTGGTDTGETDTGGDDTGGDDTGGADTGTTTGDTTGGADTGTTGGGSTSGGSTDGGGTGGSTGGATGGSTGGSSSGGSTSGGSTGGSEPEPEPIETETGSGDEIPAPTVSAILRVLTGDGLSLTYDGDTFDALIGTDATVEVEVTTDAIVEAVQVDVDGVTYVLEPQGDGSYIGVIRVPSTDSVVYVAVDTVEAPTAYAAYFVDVRTPGLVYESLNNSRTPVGGAVITIYQVVDRARIPWSGTSNPFLVGASGSFSFYVPNGTYVITVGKAGYEDATTGEVVIRDNILSPVIELRRTAEPIAEEIVPVVPDTTKPAAATPVASVVAAVTAIIATPEVQTAIDVAKPATAVLAATSVVVLASSFNLLPFLQYLFTAPVLFFARRKRKAFGVVYNAATKLPIDLAIVRIFSMPERRLVRSVVTDAKGKYLLAIAPGIYTLIAAKERFAFPSQLLNGVKDDGTYLDVYTGQSIEVTDTDATIAANIPLDPANNALEQHSPRTAALRRFLRVLQHVIALLGIVLAFIVLVIAPSVFAALMLVLQSGVYLLTRRLAHPRRAKGWGIVYDAATRQPVGNAVVRLFEPTYNKLVETAITDRLGRYAFLVGPSEYYVTYSKPGYTEKIVRPIDYRKNTEPTALALDVPIDEHKEDV